MATIWDALSSTGGIIGILNTIFFSIALPFQRAMLVGNVLRETTTL